MKSVRDVILKILAILSEFGNVRFAKFRKKCPDLAITLSGGAPLWLEVYGHQAATDIFGADQSCLEQISPAFHTSPVLVSKRISKSLSGRKKRGKLESEVADRSFQMTSFTPYGWVVCSWALIIVLQVAFPSNLY